MTSIIAPWAAATRLASTAQARLADASRELRHQAPPRPIPVDEFRVGIPEHSGPDAPDNPWFIAPPVDERPAAESPVAIARSKAAEAVANIDRAIALGSGLSAGTVLAFTRAREEALLGVRSLSSHPMELQDAKEAALQFDAAGLWLGLAKNLIALGNNTLPLPIGTPDPITIQLPDPTSPIQ